MSARGCLVTLVTFVGVVLVVLWFALPPVVGGLATAALATAGFGGTDTRVEVGADPPLRLLFLDADRVHIRSTNASVQNVKADSVDVTLRDVSIGGRRFGSIEGVLQGVRVTPAEGPTFEAREVQIAGPSEAARATITIARDAVQNLVGSAVARALGTTAGTLTLSAPDRVSIALPRGAVTGRLAVNQAGDLVLLPSSGGSIPVLGTGPGQPVRLQSVQVAGEDLELSGTIDLREQAP